MTVCLVTDNFPPDVGGVGIFYRHLSRNLAAAGNKVIVLCFGNNKGADDEITEENGIIKVRLQKEYNQYFQFYKSYFRPGGHDAPHWLAMGMSVRNWLIQHSKSYRIDIIEVSDYGGLGFFLLHSSLPPYIVTANSALQQLQSFSHFSETNHITVIKKLEALAFRYAGSIISHSPLNQSSLEPIVQRKVELVTAPWSGLDHQPVTSRSAPPLVVGGLQATKGAIYMAAIVEEIVLKDPSFVMHWIGYDSYTSPTGELMSVFLARQFPIIWNRNFIWLGEKNHEQTLEAIAQSSLVMIPSTWETFSYVAIEAAAMKKPIIMTATTGAAYLFDQGSSALIVSPENKLACATAIMQLHQNPDMGKGFAYNTNTVIEKLHPSISVPERINVYREVIESSIRHGDAFDREFKFLDHYLTPTRKLYYRLRTGLKKIFKANAGS
ncbi:MAG: glycosyltransferase family 4 protein [Flavisolibacter sp.]